jgi:hypothetical protein
MAGRRKELLEKLDRKKKMALPACLVPGGTLRESCVPGSKKKLCGRRDFRQVEKDARENSEREVK